MSKSTGFNRRSFLRSAGLSAVAGAVGSSTAIAGLPRFMEEPADGRYDFDTPYDRSDTDCFKWDYQYQKWGKENVQVGMGIADMDFRAAPCIGRALADRSAHENWGYMSTPKAFNEAIVAWNQKRYGLDIDPDSLVLSSGVHPGIVAALRAFAPQGSKVILMPPTYSAFYSLDLKWSKTEAMESPLRLTSDGHYAIDFDDLESRIGLDTHVLILCNPQNPTGNCWSQDDLMRLGRLCLERRVVVLSDEIHCDFVTKGQKYTPFASLPDKDVVNNSLTFKAASKSFSLAAMKTGWWFSTNPDFVRRVKDEHFVQLNTLGIVANHAALTEGEDWLDQVLSYLDGNHDLVESYVQKNMPMVRYKKAQGTYLAWLDVADVVDKIDAEGKAATASKTSETRVTAAMEVEKWFVDNAKVQVNPGHSFGKGGEHRMRMNIATSRQTLQLALDNMAGALATL